ncbi:MAG TPA: thermonuclease family protein [Candidatus Binatia bacterium]
MPAFWGQDARHGKLMLAEILRSAVLGGHAYMVEVDHEAGVRRKEDMKHRCQTFWIPVILTLVGVFPLGAGEGIGVNVVRVIDGDTIAVCCIQGKEEKVRYIGVNTPETQHPAKGIGYYGREAATANSRLVEGRAVRLEFDVQQRDRYGRLLAYVYLEDGTFVNAWLVQEGYAQVMTVPPNVNYQEFFLKLQREAREAGRGLWGR